MYDISNYLGGSSRDHVADTCTHTHTHGFNIAFHIRQLRGTIHL